MKKYFVFLFVLSASLMINAQEAISASDFNYDLNSDGTGVVILEYKGTAKDVIIPSDIEDFPVVALDSEAFYQTDIVSVVIPDTVEVIDEAAFKECVALTKVTLPKNLKSISRNCFHECNSLKEINLPQGLVAIKEYAFVGTGLESITIPDTVEVIDEATFARCTALTAVNIGKGIKSIGIEAFSGCSSLTSVNFGVQELLNNYFEVNGDRYYGGYVGDNVFNGCSSLSLKEKAKIRKTGYRGRF